jgi:hypothetical protein
MFICICTPFLTTTCFKAVRDGYELIKTSQLSVFSESSVRMDNLVGSLIWENQKRTILCHWGGAGRITLTIWVH